MRRDLELVRKILLAVEALRPEQEYATWASDLVVEGYSQEQVVYHVGILSDVNLVHVTVSESNEDTDYIIGRLSWSGHEFVDAARDESRWNKLLKAGWQVVQAAGWESAKRLLQSQATEFLNRTFATPSTP